MADVGSKFPAEGAVLEGGEAGVEAGGAGIAHDVLLRLAEGFREILECWGLEGEITHDRSNLSVTNHDRSTLNQSGRRSRA